MCETITVELEREGKDGNIAIETDWLSHVARDCETVNTSKHILWAGEGEIASQPKWGPPSHYHQRRQNIDHFANKIASYTIIINVS